MLKITRQADQDEAWDSVWVGDSILAKPRLDSIALLSGLALQTTRLRMGPACFASTPLRPALPIWVTANPEPHHTKFRERSFRRTARLGDGWMVTGFTPEIIAESLDELRGYAPQERGGSLPDDYEVAVYYNINVNEDREQALEESKRFLDAYYTTDYPRDYLEMWVALGSPEQCIREIQSFIDADATTITLRLAGYDQQHQYRRVTQEVLPAFSP